MAVKEELDFRAPVDTPVVVPDSWQQPGSVVAAYNQKGGTGKSEVSKGLTAAFRSFKVPTITIDFDPHGVLTAGLGHQLVSSEANLANLLTGKWQGSILDLVVDQRGMLIVPSSVDMALVEQDLASVRFREERLRQLLKPVREKYNVLIDCPNNPGLLNDNALIAVASEPERDTVVRRSGLLLVMQLEESSIHALELLLDQVDSINTATRYKVEILGWAGNMVHATANIVGETREKLKTFPITPFGEIPIRTTLKDAWAKGLTIEEFNPRSPIHHYFRQVAYNLMRRIND